MSVIINDVKICIEDESRNFEKQVFHLTYFDQNYVNKVIHLDLRKIKVVSNGKLYGQNWLYIIKSIDFADYSSNLRSYYMIIQEVHNRIKVYMENIYGVFNSCILGDHESNVYGVKHDISYH